jgi:hypothetical protein
MTECISSPSVFAAKDLISKTLVRQPDKTVGDEAAPVDGPPGQWTHTFQTDHWSAMSGQ